MIPWIMVPGSVHYKSCDSLHYIMIHHIMVPYTLQRVVSTLHYDSLHYGSSFHTLPAF